jgi:hypothetical protein
MNLWYYVFNSNEGLSENIQKLTQQLSFKSIELFTEDTFDVNNTSEWAFKQFNINSVRMTGDVVSLRMNLINAFNEIQNYLTILVNISEAEETKIYELLKSRLYIKGFYVQFNLNKPGTLEGNFMTKMHNIQQQNSIEIRYNQWFLLQNATNEIQEHQQVRYDYLELLDSHLAIELDRLYLKPLDLKIQNELSNSEKEINLLEVWLGLKLAGFMDDLTDPKLLSNHRKAFFELFKLTDRDYNFRHKEFKKRKMPVAKFIIKLTTLLQEYSWPSKNK